MRILCAFGRHQYGQESLGVGTEYSAFLPALRILGHTVEHVDTWTVGKESIAEINDRLLRVAEKFRPEVLLTVHILYEIWTETVDEIRRRFGTIAITWTTDDSWKYTKVSHYIASHYDCITTTYDYVVPRYHRDGHENVCLTQWAARDDAIKAPLPAGECDIEVSFVGAAHGNRRKMISSLRDFGISVQCFGSGWNHGPVTEAQMVEIMRRSFISLNFANSRGHNQIKARTFEVPGAGGFLVTQPARGLERWYRPGIEMEVFTSLEDLAMKIAYYRANPGRRDLIATAGHNRTVVEHLYSKRLDYVLQWSLNHAQGSRIPKHAPGACGVQSRGSRGSDLIVRVARALHFLAARAIGSKLSMKIIRRVLFEMSIRVYGEVTFSRNGIPVRVFPNSRFGP
jgi:spore maturation protein CgeB